MIKLLRRLLNLLKRLNRPSPAILPSLPTLTNLPRGPVTSLRRCAGGSKEAESVEAASRRKEKVAALERQIAEAKTASLGRMRNRNS